MIDAAASLSSLLRSNSSRRPLGALTWMWGGLAALLVSAHPTDSFGATPVAAEKPTDAQILQDLRTSLDRWMGADQFSGSVLIAKEGKVLFKGAYGSANHAFNAPNAIDTKFNLGSMGKMFTAVAILQLVQQGMLSLDDKLSARLRDYPNKDVADKVTIHQLLTHTSGLGDFFGKEFAESSMSKFVTLDSILPLFVEKPLKFEPGTSWAYSNAGYIVLGLIVERVSGTSYYDYVREHIFKPAGMANTDNYNIDADVPNLALGYTKMGEPPSAPRKSNIFRLQRGGSAGGGYSTAEDLLRFSQALQQNRLLNRELTQLLMTGKVQTPRGAKYAYGLEEQLVNGVRVVGHGGAGPGISSNLDMYPDLGYTVVVMSNYDGGATLVNSRLRWELSGRAVPSAVHLPTDALKRIAGSYSIVPPPNAPPAKGQRPPLVITADEQGLWLDVGAKHRFLPLSATEFFDEDMFDARVSIAAQEHGRVTELMLTGIGPAPTKAKRLP